MKSFAKINLFLKVLKKDTSYHHLASRFILNKKIYDEIFLIKKPKDFNGDFYLKSDFVCEDNILYKAHKILLQYYPKLKYFFENYGIELIKNIPNHSGLGASGSNAATFLKIISQNAQKIEQKKMMEIASKISADCSFFASGYECANVFGFGDDVRFFDDELPLIDLHFTGEKCVTKDVFLGLLNHNFDNSIKMAKTLCKLKNNQLSEFKNTDLNDLYTPCIKLYENMKKYQKNGFFLSGSGSSVFKFI